MLRHQTIKTLSARNWSKDRGDKRKFIGVVVGVIAFLAISYGLFVVFSDPAPLPPPPVASTASQTIRPPSGSQFTDPSNLANLQQMEQQFKQMSARVNTGLAVFGVVWLIFVLVFFIAIAFWVWMVVAVATLEPPTHDKTSWTLIVLFLGPLGATIYYFARYIKLTKI